MSGKKLICLSGFKLYYFLIMDLMIRKAELKDLNDILELFKNTIQVSCIKDYDPEQIDAWIDTVNDKEHWLGRIIVQYFLVAETDNKIVGFGSLGKKDFLDLLYIRHEYQHRGIAGKIYSELENESRKLGSKKLYSEVSITARPFFEKRGFSFEKENRFFLKGIKIVNFRMSKNL